MPRARVERLLKAAEDLAACGLRTTAIRVLGHVRRQALTPPQRRLAIDLAERLLSDLRDQGRRSRVSDLASIDDSSLPVA